jgi:hypothetical protein
VIFSGVTHRLLTRCDNSVGLQHEKQGVRGDVCHAGKRRKRSFDRGALDWSFKLRAGKSASILKSEVIARYCTAPTS